MQFMPHAMQTTTIVIPMEDPILHTEGHPFCPGDSECPCRSDVDNLNLLVELVNMGLLTIEESQAVRQGTTI